MRRRPSLLGTLRWLFCAAGGHAPAEPVRERDSYRCACGAKERTAEELVDGSGYDPFDRYLGAL